MILATLLLGQAYISAAEEILWLLDAKSLLACSATCTRLNDIVTTSSRLQLALRCEYHGRIEGLPAITDLRSLGAQSTRERLDTLVDVQKRWATLQPRRSDLVAIEDLLPRHRVLSTHASGGMLVIVLGVPDEEAAAERAARIAAEGGPFHPQYYDPEPYRERQGTAWAVFDMTQSRHKTPAARIFRAPQPFAAMYVSRMDNLILTASVSLHDEGPEDVCVTIKFELDAFTLELDDGKGDDGDGDACPADLGQREPTRHPKAPQTIGLSYRTKFGPYDNPDLIRVVMEEWNDFIVIEARVAREPNSEPMAYLKEGCANYMSLLDWRAAHPKLIPDAYLRSEWVGVARSLGIGKLISVERPIRWVQIRQATGEARFIASVRERDDGSATLGSRTSSGAEHERNLHAGLPRHWSQEPIQDLALVHGDPCSWGLSQPFRLHPPRPQRQPKRRPPWGGSPPPIYHEPRVEVELLVGRCLVSRPSPAARDVLDSWDETHYYLMLPSGRHLFLFSF